MLSSDTEQSLEGDNFTGLSESTNADWIVQFGGPPHVVLGDATEEDLLLLLASFAETVLPS